MAPTGMTLHAYQVGFGDCFLLAFHYKSARDRHVLIDFGSTGLPKTAPKNQMTLIAQDIASVCRGALDALVLSHRHKDHMSGFETAANHNGPGDIIRGLRPKLVIQPWTEDPKAKKDATTSTAVRKTNALRVASLDAQRVAVQNVMTEARMLAAARSGDRDRAALESVVAEGMEGILNASAVRNLQTMAPPEKHRYVFHGSNAGLGSLLPGVSATVLGPPTLKQSDGIRKERSRDDIEFWMLQELDARFWRTQARIDRFLIAPTGRAGGSGPFPKAKAVQGVPGYARWFVPRVRAARAHELLGIVRILDKEMNNTSVILLFEIGSAGLLFPGDAQIENWDLTLQNKALMKRLRGVTFYKVGHHGSRNATPKSLWNGFANKSRQKRPTRLRTVVSTMAGKFGAQKHHTEVPRRTLVTALKDETEFFSTQQLVRKDHSLKQMIEFKF